MPASKNNVIFLSQTLVHISRHTVEIAKRRHRADRAVREEGLEFPFALQRDVLAYNLPELLKIDQMFCRRLPPSGAALSILPSPLWRDAVLLHARLGRSFARQKLPDDSEFRN